MQYTVKANAPFVTSYTGTLPERFLFYCSGDTQVIRASTQKLTSLIHAYYPSTNDGVTFKMEDENQNEVIDLWSTIACRTAGTTYHLWFEEKVINLLKQLTHRGMIGYILDTEGDSLEIWFSKSAFREGEELIPTTHFEIADPISVTIKSNGDMYHAHILRNLLPGKESKPTQALCNMAMVDQWFKEVNGHQRFNA